MSPNTETILEGQLEHITFYNDETHYMIARLRANDSKGPVSVLGYMPDPNIGESIRLTGSWQSHPRYGQQFRFEMFEVLLPTSVAQITAYLQSGIIPGIGPKTVARIVACFEDKTIEIIENDPIQLTKIKGIGVKTANRMAKEWKNHHAARSLIQFLQKNGIKPFYTAKLMRLYGDDAEKVLRDDPFRVVTDLPKNGFYIADRIIQSADITVDHEQRVKACLCHLLDQAINEGHTFEYENRLLKKTQDHFQIDIQSFRKAMSQLSDQEDIIIDSINDTDLGAAVYPSNLHSFETAIAQRLCATLCIPKAIPDLDSEIINATILKRLAIKLSEQQQQILMSIISQKVSIVTGGPGTGKTTLIQSITAVLESLQLRIMLAAPTGRAARRISELTRRPAATLHKLLGCSIEDGYFEKDQDDPLDTDVVVIDEASMMDMPLFYHLLKAVPLTSMLILVGDVFQLPSVGPGNVLSDLISSDRIPTYELTEIFRQAQKSSIVINAHRIRKGQLPELKHSSEEMLSDFYFIEQGHPESVVNTIVELYVEKIPKYFALNPTTQIQVLTPMHKGVAGTLNLNRTLQERLNPHGEKIKSAEGTFRIGDKVMHLRNNYQKEIFNGDIGIIEEIDSKNEKILVDYSGRQIIYDQTELDELTLAYAISIHKSQGSEYPAIIVPILTQHYALLQRNLLYTAVTRGKQLVILIGTKKALSIALGNNTPGKRNSGLATRIAENTSVEKGS